MRSSVRWTACVPLVAMLISLVAAQGAGAADHVPGEVVVRFEPGVDAAQRRALRDEVDGELERVLLLPRTQVVTVAGTVADAVRELRARPDVAYAAPNYVYRNSAAAPADPRFAELWGLSNVGQTVNGFPALPGVDVGALAAWDVTRGAGQVIAIVDGGVALGHPDLAPNLWTNPDEMPANGKDDDGNGFVDDVHGWNFYDYDNDPSDQGTSHGTHVAGTAAAVAGNGVGVAGVAPEARIMALTGTGPDGTGYSSDLADGIAYAAENGATVINGSFSGQAGAKDPLMESAIAYARAWGAVVVVAAGNDDRQNVDVQPTYPCAYPAPNLLCVAALDPDGSLASYSNVGAATVDVGAPGTDVLSTSSYATLFADDFATPLDGRWTLGGSGTTWGIENGTLSDSPGGTYGPNANATVTSPSVSLVGRSGCFADWWQRRATEPSADYLRVSVVDAGSETIEQIYSGSNGGFRYAQLPLDDYGSSGDVRVRFTLASNATNQLDGVQIDDFAMRCMARPQDFDATSYEYMQGTSMASPHVAGVVALLRAGSPGLGPDAAVAQVKATAVPTTSLQGVTATGGRASAAAALLLPPASPAPAPALPVASAPPPLTRPPGRCAALSGRRLATCKLQLRIARTCGKLARAKKALCAKRLRALAKCKRMSTVGRRARVKRAACITKAKAIGKPRAKRKTRTGRAPVSRR